MANIIIAKIDCTLISKKHLYPGKKKNKKDLMPQYLELVLMPSKPTNFGDWRDEQTHMIVQGVTKAERDAGVRGEILGNAVEKVGDRDRRPPTVAQASASGAAAAVEDDGLDILF